MTREIAQALGNLSEKINETNKRIDYMLNLLNSQRASDIDYIAMESGIELEQDEEV